jgi:hypothetical protein
VLPENFVKMYQEKIGLKVLGESGLKVVLNCHGIDFLMYPWLRELVSSYKNFQLTGGLFSHIIAPLFSKEYIDWQYQVGQRNICPSIPISFYPEFCNPEKPKDNFWLLDSQSHYYSYSEESGVVSWENEAEINAPAINFNGRIGLVMKERTYKPILEAFFLAQRLPDVINDGRSNLDLLIDQIANVQELVLWPLDLEATYVGSYLGQIFWQKFISRIKERKLEKIFLGFDEVFADLSGQAVSTKDSPHRNLMKWTSLPATFNIYSRLSLRSRQPLSHRQKLLLAIAGGADIAAAIYQKSSQKIFRPAMLPTGEISTIYFSGSKEIIDATYLALNCLEKNESFAQGLKRSRRNKGFFWQRLFEVASSLKI